MISKKQDGLLFKLKPVLSVHRLGEPQVESYALQSYQERMVALEDLKRLYHALPKRKSAVCPMSDDSSFASDFTIQEVLAAFVKHGVEFVVIGGYAVAFHGYVRLTKDVDLFIHRTTKNAERIVSAFGELNFNHPELTVEGLMKLGSVYKFGRVPDQVELLNEVKGITWDEARSHAIPEKLLEQPVYFLELETLIKSKKAVGRLQDLADVEALERILRDSWLGGC